MADADDPDRRLPGAGRPSRPCRAIHRGTAAPGARHARRRRESSRRGRHRRRRLCVARRTRRVHAAARDIEHARARAAREQRGPLRSGARFQAGREPLPLGQGVVGARRAAGVIARGLRPLRECPPRSAQLCYRRCRLVQSRRCGALRLGGQARSRPRSVQRTQRGHCRGGERRRANDDRLDHHRPAACAGRRSCVRSPSSAKPARR